MQSSSISLLPRFILHFFLGVVFKFNGVTSVFTAFAIFTCAVIVLSVCTRYRIINNKRFLISTFLLGTVCVLGGILGYLSAWQAEYTYKTHQLQSVIKHQVITGKVVSIPEWITSKEGEVVGQRFVFDIEHSSHQTPPTPMRVRLNHYLSSNQSNHKKQGIIEHGQTWMLAVKLTPPHGFDNGVGFNYTHWLFTQDIHATGYVKTAIWLSDAPKHSWASQRQRLLNHFSNNGAAGQLHSALILGDKRAIPKEDYDLFIRTGTAHLFAISGLHVGMVASIGYFLGYGVVFMVCYGVGGIRFRARSLILQPNLHTAGLLGAWALAGIYCVLAGFTLPTQRAFTVLSCAIVFNLMGKKTIGVDTLLVSFFAVLALDPKAFYSVGFWLSFSAVGWILYLVHVCPFERRLFKALWVYLLLPVLLAPLNVYFFGQSATTGALANVVLIPLFSLLVLPVALLDSFFGFFDINISGLNSLYNVIYYSCLHLLNVFDLGVARHVYVNLTQVLLISFGLAVFLLPNGIIPIRRLQWLCGVTLITLAYFVALPRSIQNGQFEAHVLDVGQGLSIVLQTQNHTLVYDTGDEFRTGFKVAEATLLPFLNAKHVKRIDALVISHSDSDHSGGTQAVVHQFKVDKIVAGQSSKLDLEFPKPEIAACEAGQSWVWDGVVFTVLWPEHKLNTKGFDKDNNQSCVLHVQSHNKAQSLLMTGDIEARVERALLQQNTLQPVDVLVVAHHGSISSSSEAFLDKVRPQYALISAGAYNRFNHPNAKVVARFRARGVQWLNTAQCGRIVYSNDQVKCNTPR